MKRYFPKTQSTNLELTFESHLLERRLSRFGKALFMCGGTLPDTNLACNNRTMVGLTRPTKTPNYLFNEYGRHSKA